MSMLIDSCVLLEENWSICCGLSIVPCVSKVPLQLRTSQILCTVCFRAQTYVDSETKKEADLAVKYYKHSNT